MPYSGRVVDAVWGKGCDFDSEGDFDHRHPESWRELQARLRPDLKEEIDIHVPTEDPDLIQIQATHESILKKATDFLIASKAIKVIESVEQSLCLPWRLCALAVQHQLAAI
jgi:hypothetical protein